MVSGQDIAAIATKYFMLSYNAIKPLSQNVVDFATKYFMLSYNVIKPLSQNVAEFVIKYFMLSYHAIKPFISQNVANIATKFNNQNRNNKTLFAVITIVMITIVVRVERFTSHTIESVSSLSIIPIMNIIINSTSGSNAIQCSNGDCDMAYTDSYGFFDDIPNEAWLHKKHITTKTFPSWYLYPNSPEINHAGTSPHWFGFNVHAMFSCDFMTRVGGYGDGGKFLCDPHRISKKKECLIYSIGSNGQYEFEEDMQKQISEFSQRPWDPNPNKIVELINHYPCEIHIFDPSPNYGSKATAAKNMYYHAWGIKTDLPSNIMDGADASKLQFLTFDETLQKLNHTHRHIDVFKIDCEGCEWTAYNDILRHSNQITQIQIEIHPNNARPKDVTYPKFMNAFRDNHWIPFYREPNPFDGRVIEYCFIRLRNFYNDVDK